MRLRLALTTIFSTAVMPAFAHTGHGFEMPGLLHVITHADHMVVILCVGTLSAIAGGIMISRARK
jgi:hydrogenase/urease accessory protein HupE